MPVEHYHHNEEGLGWGAVQGLSRVQSECCALPDFRSHQAIYGKIRSNYYFYYNYLENVFFSLIHTTTYWIEPTKTMASSSNIMGFFKVRGDVFPNNLH